ncbi:precorrin-2 dehydrogenase/sirohydrochlorin ferrochelatase family protein [Pedobacter sp.]|uniref:precorrin-2 dehydrogenase/sirohydrochlorin ferrochelatase family protein n=1 Tax=Pedobacter sp. TaxID=1411316 RepID=UPI003D7F7EB6
MESNPLFPVFLKLHTLHTLVVGAGPVGLEKLNALLTNSPLAQVTVVALEIIPEVEELIRYFPNVRLHQKQFEVQDLDHVNLVLAATNNEILNREIQAAAKARKLLVNFADKPELCDFYLGSVVKKGDLKIAISTNGKSPTVAKRLKEVLSESLPDDIDLALQQMAALRLTLEGDFTEKVKVLNEITSVLIENKKQ